MRFRALWGVINAIVLVVVSWGAFSYLVGGYSVEIDEVSVATYVVDGDTFDVAIGDRVRLTVEARATNSILVLVRARADGVNVTKLL